MLDLSRLFRRCLGASYLHVEGGADFAVSSADGVLYILFQWSRGAEDWKNNLDFPAVPYRDMADRWYCHRGFLRVWRGAEPYIAQILAQSMGCEVPEARTRVVDLMEKLLPIKTMSEYGVQEADVERFTDSVFENQMRLVNNAYVPMTREKVEALYRAVL